MTRPVTREHTEVFAQKILDYLVANERSIRWLSRQVGLSPSTLTYQLRNPSALSLEVALRIEDATAVTIDREVAA